MSGLEQSQQQKIRAARWGLVWMGLHLLQLLGFAVCAVGILWAGPDNGKGWFLASCWFFLARKILEYVLFKSAESLDPEIAGDLPRASLFSVILVVALGLFLITMNPW